MVYRYKHLLLYIQAIYCSASDTLFWYPVLQRLQYKIMWGAKTKSEISIRDAGCLQMVTTAGLCIRAFIFGCNQFDVVSTPGYKGPDGIISGTPKHQTNSTRRLQCLYPKATMSLGDMIIWAHWAAYLLQISEQINKKYCIYIYLIHFQGPIYLRHTFF